MHFLRQIGQLETPEQADILRWYLISCNIDTKVENLEPNDTDIWVIHDRDLKKAELILKEYKHDPQNIKYLNSAKHGKQKHKNKVKELIKSSPREINVRTHIFNRPTGSGEITVTYLLMAISTIYFLTQITKLDQQGSIWKLLTISQYCNHLFLEALNGQVWRVITPIFIHHDVLHILFNMYWLYTLGKTIETKIGSKKLFALVILISIPSNIAFYLVAGPSFGGMSGVIYGLIFFMWTANNYSPKLHFDIDDSHTKFFTVWYVLCLILSASRVFPIANTVHGVGALMGVLSAYSISGHWKIFKTRLRFNKTDLYNLLIGISLIFGGILTDYFLRVC